MNRILTFLFISMLALSCSASPDTVTANKSIETAEPSTILASNPVTEDNTPKISTTVEPEETNPGKIKKAVVSSKVVTTTREEIVPKTPIGGKAPIQVAQIEQVDPTPEGTQIGTPSTKEEASAIEVVITKPDHATFDEMLQTYINSSGVVNYRGWKGDMTNLDQYLTILSQNEPDNSWSRSEKMAYWINLYNASTIKLILDNYPVKSIMDINGGKPWAKKWIKVGTHTYSLNQIENDIIRPRFGDGRIHFAINCAAKSCPPIHNRAFTASNLNGNLARLSRKFVNNTAFNQISKNKLQLSSIFDWYGSDFGDLKEFIGKYTDVEINADANISFMEYDWALNGR